MTAIAYLLEQQKKLRMPMSILVTLGTNSGSHTGAEALDKYINNIGELQGLAVATRGEQDIIIPESSQGHTMSLRSMWQIATALHLRYGVSPPIPTRWP